MLEWYDQMSDEERAKWAPSLLVLEEEVTTEETEAVEETIAETTEPTYVEEVVEEIVEETTEPTYVEEVVEETFEETTETTYVEDAIEETEIPETTEVFEEIEIPKETTAEEKLHTGKLTARKGYIIDSPCGGSETWYPDAPVGAVRIMEKLYGFTDLKMTVREDGVRILSGTSPSGETFKDLVVVAADIRYLVEISGVKCIRNPKGIFGRGDLVETSLGPGIVVDFCERAVNERIASGHMHIDIATDWNYAYKYSN